jgi:recombinational DNA repair protein (RecF pathway)
LLAGWVDHFSQEVRAGSKAYAELYIQVLYERSNPYQNHPLLPFHVLTRLPPGGRGQASNLRECSGCRRQLNKSCFKRKSARFCYVCGCVNDRIKRGFK